MQNNVTPQRDKVPEKFYIQLLKKKVDRLEKNLDIWLCSIEFFDSY